MNDRERRLHRAQVRLADAHALLDLVTSDLIMIRQDLGAHAERMAASARWACREVGKELRKGEAE